MITNKCISHMGAGWGGCLSFGILVIICINLRYQLRMINSKRAHYAERSGCRSESEMLSFGASLKSVYITRQIRIYLKNSIIRHTCLPVYEKNRWNSTCFFHILYSSFPTISPSTDITAPRIITKSERLNITLGIPFITK